jgi:hypothetical protein
MRRSCPGGVGAVDWCSTVIALPADNAAGRAGGAYSGAANGFGDKDPFEKSQGWISAIDADTGVCVGNTVRRCL